jgi:hypothetical protein
MDAKLAQKLEPEGKKHTKNQLVFEKEPFIQNMLKIE